MTVDPRGEGVQCFDRTPSRCILRPIRHVALMSYCLRAYVALPFCLGVYRRPFQGLRQTRWYGLEVAL